MSRIYQLPIHVANQIAAGEVIERPASVVKELLENSLDAGADEINIEIRFGGLNQIKISDNGFGIIQDDLHLAILPHATSKLNDLSDLTTLSSMGFRGEALASIASISRLSLHSKPALQEHAQMLSVDENGYKITPCPRVDGTTVDVRDLFFNTPVRKSFLKTERIEYQAIEFVVKRFALSAPEIAITLTHNGRKMLMLPKAECERTHLSRVQTIFGKGFVDNALLVNCERAGLRLHGWISGVEDQRSQNDKQWVYLNRRMIKDKLIQSAIMQAYQKILYPGRYPTCLLYLSVPTHEVDVNVHPTKHEVRFQDPRLIRDFIYATLTETLASVEEIATAINESTPIISSNPQWMPASSWKYEPLNDVPAKTKSSLYGNNDVKQSMSLHLDDDDNFKSTLLAVNFYKMLNKRFMLSCLDDNLFYLLDVSAILRHQYQTQLKSQKLPLISRPLLVPVKIAISATKFSHLQQSLEVLAQIGVSCELLSEELVLLKSIPLSLQSLDLQKFISQITQPLSLDNIFQHCLQCLALDPLLLEENQYLELINYVNNNLSKSAELRDYCVVLDEDNCNLLYNT